jgi:hypothetical protein
MAIDLKQWEKQKAGISSRPWRVQGNKKSVTIVDRQGTMIARLQGMESLAVDLANAELMAKAGDWAETAAHWRAEFDEMVALNDEMKEASLLREQVFSEFKTTALRLAENARLLHRKACAVCTVRFCEERTNLDVLVAMLERNVVLGGQ